MAITSGANINFERLRLVSELANVGALTEATLATTLPEQAGAFKAFVDTVVSTDSSPASNGSKEGGSIQFTEFKYRRVFHPPNLGWASHTPHPSTLPNTPQVLELSSSLQ